MIKLCEIDGASGFVLEEVLGSEVCFGPAAVFCLRGSISRQIKVFNIKFCFINSVAVAHPLCVPGCRATPCTHIAASPPAERLRADPPHRHGLVICINYDHKV